MGKVIVGFALFGAVLVSLNILWWSWLSMVVWGAVAHSIDASYFLPFKTAITYVGLAGAALYGLPLVAMALIGLVTMAFVKD